MDSFSYAIEYGGNVINSYNAGIFGVFLVKRIWVLFFFYLKGSRNLRFSDVEVHHEIAILS